MFKTLIAAVVVLAFAGTAPAQEKKPAAPPAGAAPAAGAPAAGAPAAGAPPMPQPSKELAAFMKPFEGSWKCETKFPANAFGPGSPEVNAKSTVKFTKDKDLGGFFYRGEYAVAKQKGVPMPLKGIFYIGWDPGTQGVVVTNVDNMGTAGMSTGKIEGDTVTYTGEAVMMGAKVKTRESMGKKSDKEAWHKAEIDMGKGWMPFGEDTCKR
jgi:hypothetical protein